MTRRTQPPRNGGPEAVTFTRARDRRHCSSLSKYYAIKDVAEALAVSNRTVRRWIARNELAVHRMDGVVRIADRDLRAFLAQHRED